jgi:hypothetical protein
MLALDRWSFLQRNLAGEASVMQRTPSRVLAREVSGDINDPPAAAPTRS